MMKRRHMLGGALAAGTLGVAGALWWALSSVPVSMIAAQINAETGLTLRTAEPAVIALLPRPRIKLQNVTLTNADGVVLADMKQLQAGLDVGGMLTGRLDVDTLRLAGATFSVEVDAKGHSAWMPAVAWLQGSLDAPPGAIEDIVLSDTRLIYRDRRFGRQDDISDIEGSVGVAGGAESLMVGLTGRWRGETVNLSAIWPSPTPGSGASAMVRLRSSLADLTLDGTISGTEPKLQGRLSLKTASLARLAAWTGFDGPFFSRIPAISLSGPIVATSREVEMPAAVLMLGADRLEGALTLRHQQSRPVLAGTLAAQSFNLDPLMPAAATIRTADGWSASPIDWMPMTRADLDLRLSAAKASGGSLLLDQVALALNLRAGRLEANLVRAGLDNGNARGRVTITPADSGLDIRGQAAIERVDATTVLAPLFPSRPVSGMSQGQLSFDASGATAAQLVSTATGKGTLSIRNGTLTGISMADVIRAADRSPPPITFDWRGGRTAFEQMNVPFAIRNGEIEIAAGQVVAAGAQGMLSGWIRIPNQSLALRAGILNPAQLARGPVMFDIAGDIGSPQVTPDIRTIIERLSPPRVAPINFQGTAGR